MCKGLEINAVLSIESQHRCRISGLFYSFKGDFTIGIESLLKDARPKFLDFFDFE